jgi:hypothetical protein
MTVVMSLVPICGGKFSQTAAKGKPKNISDAQMKARKINPIRVRRLAPSDDPCSASLGD